MFCLTKESRQDLKKSQGAKDGKKMQLSNIAAGQQQVAVVHAMPLALNSKHTFPLQLSASGDVEACLVHQLDFCFVLLV
jgi:hypothetical protein